MKRTCKLCLVLIPLLLSTTGCWNLSEPNQRAFVLGSGLDLTKNGRFEASGLIAVPAGTGTGGPNSGGSKKKSFTVLSAIGKSDFDAAQNLQRQLSRNEFLGHRVITLIGERMARHGIVNYVDEFFRNPISQMRSRVFVVKGGQAKDVLPMESYFDPYISTSLLNQLETLGLKNTYLRNFVSDALSQGTQPTLPAIGLNALNHYTYSGMGIFDKNNHYKLLGFLNPEESSYVNWIIGRQKYISMTSTIPKGKGTVSLRLTSLGHRIQVERIDNKFHIIVHLTGKGYLVENNTNLNPTKPKDFKVIQSELNQKSHQSIHKLIEKVQNEYKTDIFGFGERIHQKYPYQWNTMKGRWGEIFPELHVEVKEELHFDQGLATSPLNSRY